MTAFARSRVVSLTLSLTASLALAACGGGGSEGEKVPPQVGLVSPANGATGVAPSTTISAAFSEPMAAATLNGSTFTVSGGVTGVVVLSGTVATFTPSAPLAYATTYTATITTGATDLAGNALAAPYVWSFTTGPAPDTTAPSVVSVTPSSGATGVAVDTVVTAQFSEAMAPTSIGASTFTLSGGATGAVTYAGTTATLTPSAPLAYDTTYTATLTTGATDVAGNPLAAPHSWSFTTGPAPDTTAPTVGSVSPASGTTGVAISTTVTADFSEAMDAATITQATFTLSGGVTGAVSYAGTTATFTPDAPLAYATTYTATVGTGATDLAGNPLAAPHSWSFTTGPAPDTTAPTVVSVSPVSGATDVAISTTVAAEFSEAMDGTTVTQATFTLSGGVTGTVSYAGTTASFTPDAPLAYATTYTATIGTGATDLAGNPLAAPHSWSFTTVAAPVTPFTADASTVLLQHFDGSAGTAVQAYWESGAACGAPKPAATPNYSYGPGPNGLTSALGLYPPSGQPAGSQTYLQYSGELLSRPAGTIELWVYLTAYGSGVGLVSQGPYFGACAGWTFGMGIDGAGKLSAGAWAAFTMDSGTSTVPLNRWTHVAATWGPAGAKLFIDGNVVGSDANTGAPAAGFGGNVLVPSGGVGWRVDEFRISSVQRYSPVLHERFEGSTTATVAAFVENGAACGSSRPSATPVFSYVAGPSGQGQAIRLDPPAGQPAGSASYLRFAGERVSIPNGTLELWVYLTTYGAGVPLVEQGPYYGACSGWTFGLSVGATGQVSAGAWAAFNMNSGAAVVPLNTWTKIAVTWGSTGARLYVNDAQVGSDATTGAPAAGFGGNLLVRHGVAGHAVDELRISNVQRTFP